MKHLFLVSSGTLKRADYTLALSTNELTRYFPIESLECIHVFGELTINKRCLDFLSRYGVSIHFYGMTGRFNGGFIPDLPRAGSLLIKQVLTYQDYNQRINIARTILDAAFKNMKQNIQSYRKRLDSDVLNSLINRLDDLKAPLTHAKTIEHVLSIEGRVRQCYYQLFDIVTNNPSIRFEKRSYYPPKNHFNALISFLNVVLYQVIASIIYESKMDISIAFLHSSNQRHQSLNLDIAEVFKPILVDRLIIRMINLNMITKDDFEKDAYLLNTKGKRKILDAFQTNLRKTIMVQSRKVSYFSLIKKDVFMLKNHLLDPTSRLKFFVKRD